MSPLNESDWTAARRLFGEGGLSVVLPCHNLASSIAENLTRLDGLLAARGFPYQLIPVDDGSTDGTGVALEELSKRLPSVCPICFPENRGKGAAVLAGIQRARYDWVLLLDGDFDLDPAVLPTFCDVAMQTLADVVTGSKLHPDAQVNYPLRRRVFSALYHWLTQRCLRLPVRDTQSGMKLVRRTALDYAADRVLVKRFAFDLELLAVMNGGGFTFAEAPVRIDFGLRWGCLSFQMLWRTFIDTLAIAYRSRFLHYYEGLTPLPKIPVDTEGPRFSLIVACPGDSTVLRRLIEALKAQTYRNFEVIFLPDRLLVRPEVNYRFRILATGAVRPARKRNMGAAVATGDVLVFIDDDAYPREDWLATAAARFTDPEIHALGGPGLTPPEDPPAAQLSGAIFASPLVSGNFRCRYFIQGPLRRVEDFPSCNLFVRRSVFEAVRGFREDFWPGEDTLLCADIQRMGYALWYEPRAVVYHHRRPVFGPHLRQVGRYALHRGYFARRIGLNSRRLSYMIPSFFVLGLTLGIPVCIYLPCLWWVYIPVVTLYGLLTLADALLEAPSLRQSATFWAGLIATHLWYGVRFIQGVLSRRMPCGVLPFDHR